jgi:hypothetical protein
MLADDLACVLVLTQAEKSCVPERSELAQVMVRRYHIPDRLERYRICRKFDRTFAAVLSQLCNEKQVLAGARAKGSILHSREIIEAAQTSVKSFRSSV